MIWSERRRLPFLLAAATLIPICVLGWLGFRILQQDRDVERQRRRDAIEVAAGRLALDVERQLQILEERLDRADAGDTVIRLLSTGLTSPSDSPLLYQPDEAVDDAVARVPLSFPAEAEGAVAEYQRRDLPTAAGFYRRLSEAQDPTARASALLGLGRVLRQTGDRAGALRAYADLERLESVLVAGQPAGLVARQGRCKVLDEAGDRDGLLQAASDLAHALNAGGWPIDRATFEVYGEMAERWGAAAPSSNVRSAAIDRTEAALDLWRVWRRGDLEPRGRRFLRTKGGPVLALWTGSPERPRAALITPSQLEGLLQPLWQAQKLAVAVSDTDGQPVFNRLPSNATASVSFSPGETRLPFILSVASLTTADAEGDRARSALLISGLVVAFLLMIAAAYGLYRTTTRELGLARQQSDFVSAVSHEFRTPLTSMRHLTDLLVSRGVTSEERKTQYYELLSHETERLQRMVETLLSFGRIEAGAYAWRLEPADASEVVHASVDEFRREPVAKGREVVCDIEEGLPPIRVDREALSRALWNLLENAAKYSDADRPIRVFARRQAGSVLLGVGDEGVGIPPEERKHIFQKFVRGSDAKRAGIRGVGIGLALVSRIVEAHGGSIQLESEPGRGSTFTLVLPCPGF